MTAVARLAIQDCPMLVADLLLSAPEGPSSNWVPSGLSQKIALVADNLIVGWSGQRIVAREVIADMRRLSATRSFTNSTLQTYFDGLGSSVWSELGLVGFIIDDDRRIAQFGRSFCEWPTRLFGTVGLLGSGQPDLERFLRQFQELPESPGYAMNALEKSLSLGLFMTGTMLQSEFVTLDSWQQFYGGGYEIAAAVQGNFRKVNDVTYVFWTASVNGNDVRIRRVPLSVCRYSYVDDLLVIRAALCSESEQKVSMDCS